MLAQDAPSPPSQLTDQLIGPLGALALALLSLFVVWRAFSTGALRTGKQVDEQLEQAAKDHEAQTAELRRDRDWWRNLAMESLGVGERIAAGRRWRPPDDV